MKSIFRFLDFKVYQDAREFQKKIFNLSEKFPKEYQFNLVSQIQRSSVSVLLNIAEGSAKDSDKEFARFLKISLGSLNETLAGLDIARFNGLISEDEFNSSKEELLEIANQLGGFLKKLKAKC